MPSKHLSKNEIAAARAVKYGEFNVQSQEKIKYPKTVATAKAYLDQLERSNSMDEKKLNEIRTAIANAEKSGLKEMDLDKLKSYAKAVRKMAKKSTDTFATARMNALAEVLSDTAE